MQNPDLPLQKRYLLLFSSYFFSILINKKVNGVDVPSFRGDNVNGFTPDDRRHNPQRYAVTFSLSPDLIQP